MVCTTTLSANYLQKPEVGQYIDQLSKEHKLNADELKGLFKQISPQQSVIDKISKPAEKRLEWKGYRPIFMKPDRIALGAEFMQKHAELLAQAEQQYGVPKEIITAIIGVETKYGRITGHHPVFESVATLAFDYPPRSKFFKSELTEFLLFAMEEKMDPLSLKGSYAGAMGMAQFISSSYRRYSVDFDGDGKRDLWNSTADAIGSVANYFSVHKWVKGEAIAEPVKPKGNAYKKLLRKSLKPVVKQTQLKKHGIESALKSKGDVSVLSLQGKKGEEVWVGHHNFYVITRYNHSPLYAMAVFQLSQAIKSAVN
jgi:membrane-bound lytic murein transglycosylase B